MIVIFYNRILDVPYTTNEINILTPRKKRRYSFLVLGVCKIMLFYPISALVSKINAGNIKYMAVLNFRKCLDLRKNCYNPTDP